MRIVDDLAAYLYGEGSSEKALSGEQIQVIVI